MFTKKVSITEVKLCMKVYMGFIPENHLCENDHLCKKMYTNSHKRCIVVRNKFAHETNFRACENTYFLRACV